MSKTNLLSADFKHIGFQTDEEEIGCDEFLIRKDNTAERDWLVSGIIANIKCNNGEGETIYRRIKLAKKQLLKDQIILNYPDKRKLLGKRPSMEKDSSLPLLIRSVRIWGIVAFYLKHPRQEIRLESWGLLLITITSIAALIKFVLDIVDYFIK